MNIAAFNGNKILFIEDQESKFKEHIKTYLNCRFQYLKFKVAVTINMLGCA